MPVNCQTPSRASIRCSPTATTVVIPESFPRHADVEELLTLLPGLESKMSPLGPDLTSQCQKLEGSHGLDKRWLNRADVQHVDVSICIVAKSHRMHVGVRELSPSLLLRHGMVSHLRSSLLWIPRRQLEMRLHSQLTLRPFITI